MSASLDPSEFEIVSEVLLKLTPADQKRLPRACKVCPDALWQTTGEPKALKVRCYCPMMHVFTWGTTQDVEILDCEHLYKKEEGEELPKDDDDMPAFLREQRNQTQGGAEHEAPQAPDLEVEA